MKIQNMRTPIWCLHGRVHRRDSLLFWSVCLGLGCDERGVWCMTLTMVRPLGAGRSFSNQRRSGLLRETEQEVEAKTVTLSGVWSDR